MLPRESFSIVMGWIPLFKDSDGIKLRRIDLALMSRSIFREAIPSPDAPLGECLTVGTAPAMSRATAARRLIARCACLNKSDRWGDGLWLLDYSRHCATPRRRPDW